MSISGDKFEGVLHPIRKLKSRLGPLWWHSLLMFAATRLGDVVNLYIAIFLVPAYISQDDLGVVLPLLKLALLAGVPLSMVVRTALKYLNVMQLRGENGKIKALLQDLTVLSNVVTLGIFTAILLLRDVIQERLQFGRGETLLLVGGMSVVLCCWLPMATMVCQGLKSFWRLILSRMLSPMVRLLVVLLLIPRFYVDGYLWATLISSAVAVLFLASGVKRYWCCAAPRESYREYLPDMLRYMLPVGLMAFVFSSQNAIEPWIIRQRLSTADSAGYYIAAMFGTIPLFLSSAVIPFLFPLVSERHELGEDTRRLHMQTLLYVLLLGSAVTGLFFLTGERLLALRSSWRPHMAYAGYVWKIGLVTTMTSVINCHVTVQNARRSFGYLWYYAPIILGELAILYLAMGWPFFKKWLPADLWMTVEGWISRDLSFIVSFMLASRVLVIILVAFTVGVRGNRRCGSGSSNECA